MVSSRSATERMRSGRPAALLIAASRMAASASKVSMKSAVAISFGPIGTSALAPIIRSGTGALGSTCFWKLLGSEERGSGQAAGGAAVAWASLMQDSGSLEAGQRIEPRAPGVLPGQLADPLVEEEIARQPGNRRRPAQTQGGELRHHAGVVGRQLHRLAQRAYRLLLVASHHQRAREVHQSLGGLQSPAQGFLAEADPPLAIALHQHQRQAIIGEHPGIVQVAAPA